MAKATKKTKKSKNKSEKSPPSKPVLGKFDGDKLAQAIWQAGIGAFVSADKGSAVTDFAELTSIGRKAEKAVLRKLDTKKGRAQIKVVVQNSKRASKAARRDLPSETTVKAGTNVSDRSAVSIEAADDLMLIRGVGPALQQKLHELGMLNLRQIAELSDAEIVELEAKIGARAGLTRNDWRAQAASLLQSA